MRRVRVEDFALYLGWSNRASEWLRRLKIESSLAHRDDLVTLSQPIHADEVRG